MAQKRDGTDAPLDDSRYNVYHQYVSDRRAEQGKESAPSATLQAAVFVYSQRVADRLLCDLEETLKPAGISPTQYNVLRILRGASAEGLPCGRIAVRMITRDPDITRLLDRLENRSLVSRSRDLQDRRIVRARITGEGVQLLQTLDAPVAELHRRQLRHLRKQDLESLRRLLRRVLKIED